MYERLCGVFGRSQAAVEIDWMLTGQSKWSATEDPEENGNPLGGPQ